MPILRAGPYISLAGEYEDEPETPVVGTDPCNCALVNWVNHDWKASEEKLLDSGDQLEYVDGPYLNESYNEGGVRNSITYYFYYQSKQDAEIDVTYSTSAVSTGSNETACELYVDNVLEFGDSDFGGGGVTVGDGVTVSVSGTHRLKLPASVTPMPVIWVIYTQTGTDGTHTGSIETTEVTD